MSDRGVTIASIAVFVVLGAAIVWLQFFAPCSFARAVSSVADLPARCLP